MSSLLSLKMHTRVPVKRRTEAGSANSGQRSPYLWRHKGTRWPSLGDAERGCDPVSALRSCTWELLPYHSLRAPTRNRSVMWSKPTAANIAAFNSRPLMKLLWPQRNDGTQELPQNLPEPTALLCFITSKIAQKNNSQIPLTGFLPPYPTTNKLLELIHVVLWGWYSD